MGAYAGSPAFREAIKRGVERSATEREGILARQQALREGGGRVAGSGLDYRPSYDSGRELDKTPSVNVNGSGKISVEVKAPAGTKAGAEGEGLFKKTEVTRQVQMEPASGGPAVNAEE
jgi:hypothetical protein